MCVVYNMCCVNALSSYSEILIWPFKRVCVVERACKCFCRNRDGLLLALQQRAGAISSRSPGVMKGWKEHFTPLFRKGRTGNERAFNFLFLQSPHLQVKKRRDLTQTLPDMMSPTPTNQRHFWNDNFFQLINQNNYHQIYQDTDLRTDSMWMWI